MVKITRQALSHKKVVTQILIFLMCLFVGFADASNSVKFYLSNSKTQADSTLALHRLLGPEQHALQKGVIDTLQIKHIQQTTQLFVLGAYRNSKQEASIDNTLVIITSPYQELLDCEIVILARDLARQFKQETVAVFIPDTKSNDIDIMFSFKNNAYEMNELLSILHKKLPSSYAEGVTLYLDKGCKSVINCRVSGLEWLGNNLDTPKLKTVFPHADIQQTRGRAILVDQSGNITKI